MAILEIMKYPHEILEAECKPVINFDSALHQLLDDMFETMYSADGVGLAAPQINIAKQIAVVDITEDRSGKIELINPQILERTGEQVGVEGCLSFPGVYGDVKRDMTIIVKAQNRYGEWQTIEADDFLARAIQHEVDHLHGILFTTKVIRYYELEDEDIGGEV